MTTDCGAVNNLRGAPVNASSALIASAMALNNGTDIEMGSNLWATNLEDAVRVGATSEDAIDAALRRQLLALMKSGRFDPVEYTEWTRLTARDVNSSASQRINLEATLQSLVLLKNDGVLPLKTGARLAVIGPQAVAREGLFSDYSIPCQCYPCDYDCIETLAEGLARANVGGATLVHKGVDINSTDASGIGAAAEAARRADVAVVIVGTDTTIEAEGKDRTSIRLPGLQQRLVEEVVRTKTPVVLVMVHGGALGIEELVDGSNAIVDAFFPGRWGAAALAAALFGRENRWGRLPVTIYPNEYIEIQSMSNFNMSAYPGRTYRYLQTDPVFAFGAGLSYTTFALAKPALALQFPRIRFTSNIINTGRANGDAIMLVYHRVSREIRSRVDHPIPLKRLVGFKRTRLEAGENETITIVFEVDEFALTTNDGTRRLYKGSHELVIDLGDGFQPERLTFEIPYESVPV